MEINIEEATGTSRLSIHLKGFDMKQSPMLKHSIESFQHGLEHYLEGSERSRKFAVLHIDQAVELMLKEKVVQTGKSIYKSDGNTLSLHETFKSLKDFKLPERPRLEELHDLRNTVQHKGYTPDIESTQFYIETAYSFIKRFLDEELSIKCDSILPINYIALMDGLRLPDTEEVLTLLQEAKGIKDPTEKIVKTYTALQLVVDSCRDIFPGRILFRQTFRKFMKARGHDGVKINILLDVIMKLRNQVVHSDYSPTAKEADYFYSTAWNILCKAGIAKQFSKKERAKRSK